MLNKNNDQNDSATYLITEYEHLDSNIKYIHDQRDRWIRYYIGFIGALQGLPITVLMLWARGNLNLSTSDIRLYLAISSVFLFATGILVFMTCIYSRCHTTEYTNQINIVRKAIYENIDNVVIQNILTHTNPDLPAYRVSGADFFRHLFVTLVVSSMVPVFIICIFNQPKINIIVIMAVLGFMLSSGLLLSVRRVILQGFDKKLTDRISSYAKKT